MTKPMSSSPFFLYPIRAQCNIQSFPTRRSSDLHAQEQRNAAQNVYRSVEHDQKTGLTTFGQFHQHHSQMPRRSEDGSAGMPRPISYAVFCLKKNKGVVSKAEMSIG